jgi:hypothetical protein
MKYSYIGVFVPSESDNISDRRFHTVEKNGSVDRRLIPEIVRNDAMKNSSIDEYALRNHWTLAMGETRIVNSFWGDFNKLKAQIKGFPSVSKVKSKQSKTKSCVIGYTKSGSLKTVKNKINSMYGKDIPIFWGKDAFEIQTRFLWVGDNNYFFDEADEFWGGKLAY